MIDIHLDDREVRQALERLQRRLGDLTPVMEELGELLVERAKERFARSTDPAGRPWAPNKPSTLARKKGKKPLIGETGRLRDDIHYEAGRDHVIVGSSREYAATHQFGAKKGAFGRTRRGAPIPWGDIPARPFLPVTGDGRWLGHADRDAVLDILRRALDQAAKAHG